MDRRLNNGAPITGQLPPEHVPGLDDIQDIAAPAARHMIEGASDNTEQSNSSRQERELTAMQSLAEQHGAAIEFIPVGDAGWVCRLDRVRREADTLNPVEYGQAWDGDPVTKPVVCVDADDTLFAYTATKHARQENFARFVQEELGHEPSRDVLDALMRVCDEFCRWADNGSEKKMYHIDPHQWSVGWATSQLRGVAPEDIPDKIEQIEAALHRVKEGLGSSNGPSSEDQPFYFEGDELLLNNYQPPAGVAKVFEPVRNPVPYEDAIYDVQSIAETGALTACFTYGEPPFQLEKLLNLRDNLVGRGRGWPFEYIFLTRKPKGEFLERLLVEMPHEPQLRQDMFNQAPHVLMLVDDDQGQLDDFMSRQGAVESSTGARMCVVRTLRPDTKTWKQRDSAYRDVPGMGRVIDEHRSQGVLIRGEIEDLSADLPVDVQLAHQDAFTNLELRTYNLLAHNLYQMAQAEAEADLRRALAAQEQYYSKRAWDIERLIESTHNIPFMSL